MRSSSLTFLLLVNVLAAGVFHCHVWHPLLSPWFLVLLLITVSNLLEGGNLSLANALKEKPMHGMNTR